MTMILCGWIVLILTVQSVFNCAKDDPCCPDEDECCNDGYNGCCTENIRFYAIGTKMDECLCTPYYPRPSSTIREPFVKASWGRWGEWAECPKGEYVVGAKVKAESFQGIELSTNLCKVLTLMKVPTGAFTINNTLRGHLNIT